MNKKQRKLFIIALAASLTIAALVSCSSAANKQSSDTPSDTNGMTLDQVEQTSDGDTIADDTETTVPEIETTAMDTTDAETIAPETTAAETTAETQAPETLAPETTAAETTAETQAPETLSPVTTEAPETNAPETQTPETEDIEVTVPVVNDKPSSVGTTQTWEQGQQQLKDQANQYLQDNNIEASTAGATGVFCKHCKKEIWDPDKYGFGIPGYPEDLSQYCYGSCGIVLG